MTVPVVRTIIADPMQYDQSEGTGDGITTQFPLPNAPVADGTEVVRLDNVTQTPVTHYTLNPSLGLLTFAAPPAAGVELKVTYQFSLLSDTDIDTFLALESDNVRLAAAMALDTIASSEVLIQKRIDLLDLKTDGKAVAEALRAHAKALRERDDDVTSEEGDLFDYAEMALAPFNRKKMWWKTYGRYDN
jgi:hypothetical protein